MSAKDRKASSYAHAGNGLVEGRLYNAFVAGWDACANQQDLIELEYDEALKERDTLRAENERLKGEAKQLLTESFFKENEILNEERDRWREQAEKLAGALECKGDGYDYKRKEEALADFEAFKKSLK